MSTANLFALLPFLLIAGAAVFVMLAIAAWRRHWLSLGMTLIGLAAAFGSLWLVAPLTPCQVTPLLILDKYALFYIGLILAATFAIAILCYGYFQRHSETREELYILLLVATLGSMVLVASSHFVSFFLGLEILSVALYALSAYLHTRSRPLEAGIKYLILAGSSSAFLLFGMALIYAQTGTMELFRLATSLAGVQNSPLVAAGLTFMVTGIGFKLGVVPFHLWTPDVYEGAPAPVTAFIATVSKGAIFALLLRYFHTAVAQHLQPVLVPFAIIAIASMLIGNLLALLQTNIKRILAYSSIAHMGYLLVAFEAGGSLASEAIAFYLVAYFITIVGAFGVVTVLSSEEAGCRYLRGLCWPVLAQTGAGKHLYAYAVFSGWDSGDRWILGQVLCGGRRRFREYLGPDPHPGHFQCNRIVLLPQSCSYDVRARVGRICAACRTPCNRWELCPGGSYHPAALVWRVPGSSVECDQEGSADVEVSQGSVWFDASQPALNRAEHE